MKIYKPKDFSDMFINATFPSIQLQKAASIANKKIKYIVPFTLFLGIFIGYLLK